MMLPSLPIQKVTENGSFLLISPITGKESRDVYMFDLIHKVILQTFVFSPTSPFHQPVTCWICMCLVGKPCHPCISESHTPVAWMNDTCLPAMAV